MIFSPTPLRGSFEIEVHRNTDDRGWFMRTYCKDEFKSIGHDREWVQMNHSFTANTGSIRGIHFQRPPFREIKLVRCIRGEVYDVIIDLREGSPTFLQWHAVRLSSDSMNMLYIPEGFGHGFQTLSADCELIYCHSELYKPGFESGIRYDDPLIGIEWPLDVTQISERDLSHSLLKFDFEGI